MGRILRCEKKAYQEKKSMSGCMEAGKCKEVFMDL